MSFNLSARKRNRFGRYGDKMGKLCNNAVTASNKRDREEFKAKVQEIYQMLDDIDQATEWTPHVEPAQLAPASERDETPSGDPQPAEEGPVTAKPARAPAKRKNVRKKRAPSAKRTGTKDVG
jgi:hypothetical protein